VYGRIWRRDKDRRWIAVMEKAELEFARNPISDLKSNLTLPEPYQFTKREVVDAVKEGVMAMMYVTPYNLYIVNHISTLSQ
jgi:hypothetical protein